jgi:hypothetical protein
MKCELQDREQKLDDFLLKKMTPEDSEAFEIHAFSCPECLEELRMREQMVRVMRDEDAGHKDREKSQTSLWAKRAASEASQARHRQTRWIYYVAAAAVIMVGVFLLNRSIDTERIDSSRFEVSPYLESIVTQTFQSSDVSITNVSPRLGANISSNVFKWQAQRGDQDFVGELALKILDNKENVIHSAVVQDSQYAFNNTLEPGLYYWTLEHQGQMIYLGKFFVGKPNN